MTGLLKDSLFIVFIVLEMKFRANHLMVLTGGKDKASPTLSIDATAVLYVYSVPL